MLVRVKNKLRRITLNYALRGNNVHCNCCNKSFDIFMPFGGSIKRQNAMCPNCLSLERHRLLIHYLRNETDLFKRSLKLLHFAPERVLFQIFNQQDGLVYYPGDLSPRNYPKGTLKVDATNIPYNDHFFDVIICNHVLEHIPDDIKAMREIYRVIKPGGWAILQVPLDKDLVQTFEDPSIVTPEARRNAYGQIDHVRLYGRDYFDRLNEVGFKVQVDEYFHNFSNEEVFKYGFSPLDDIIIGVKLN